MSKQALVQKVKQIVALGRDGKLDESYVGYRELFSSPEFLANRPEDQRQALRLMVMAKNVPNPPTPVMLEAMRAALVPLTELVSTLGEPADHELLGICHLCLGHEAAASAIFKAGLATERQRSPGSDLCGELMKRISMI
jgi:hypothetical protein